MNLLSTTSMMKNPNVSGEQKTAEEELRTMTFNIHVQWKYYIYIYIHIYLFIDR